MILPFYYANSGWVPRPKRPVKTKRSPDVRNNTLILRSRGVVDIHFHGAFGIDLMTATPAELEELAARLGDAGVAGFCATTLSAPAKELRAVTEKLGKWIRHCSDSRFSSDRAALPLGIHLEGPFIRQGACGAHPRGRSVNSICKKSKIFGKSVKKT